MDLRNWRTRAGLTQAQIAHRLGVHVQYVSDLERGRRTPSYALALSIRDMSGGAISLDSFGASVGKGAA